MRAAARRAGAARRSASAHATAAAAAAAGRRRPGQATTIAPPSGPPRPTPSAPGLARQQQRHQALGQSSSSRRALVPITMAPAPEPAPGQAPPHTPSAPGPRRGPLLLPLPPTPWGPAPTALGGLHAAPPRSASPAAGAPLGRGLPQGRQMCQVGGSWLPWPAAAARVCRTAGAVPAPTSRALCAHTGPGAYQPAHAAAASAPAWTMAGRPSSADKQLPSSSPGPGAYPQPALPAHVPGSRWASAPGGAQLQVRGPRRCAAAALHLHELHSRS
jgi:hypothetical protein